jgi:DNA polymerase I-like protein with 3'-5' exonuclease and polymerase domains
MEKHAIDELVKQGFSIELLEDSFGVYGFAVSTAYSTKYYAYDEETMKLLFSTKKPVACYEMRKLERLGIALPPRLYDLKLLTGGDSSLKKLASKSGDKELSRLEEQLGYHVKACRTAKIDLRKVKIIDAAPSSLLEGIVCARAAVITKLTNVMFLEQQRTIEDYENGQLEFAKTLHSIEENGIKVDVGYVKEQLKLDQLPAAASCFRSIDGSNVNGYVYTMFNPCGGKTGRIRIEKGFNCMGIPHGPARDAIVSRFDGGKIVTFDFNAIDYRCIVQTIGEPFSDLYRGARDFHAQTTAFLFGDGGVNALRRDIVKKVTYIYIYGGARDTLQMKTQLSEEKLNDVLQRLDKKMYPINEFREELYEKSITDGYIEIPNGRRVVIAGENDMHAGKVLGLYAQTFSSYVFEKAINNVMKKMKNMKSKLVFTVHDEAVVDMHPDEFERDVEIKDEMEWAVDGYEFIVNIKSGRTYGQAK